MPGISAARWLLCTKGKHGAGCLQSLRVLPGLPELMLLFEHPSFSSCSLRFAAVFSFHIAVHDQVTGCSRAVTTPCSCLQLLAVTSGPLPRAGGVGRSPGQWVQSHFNSPQEKERQKLETLRKKQEAEQLRRQKLEEEKKRRLGEAKL